MAFQKPLIAYGMLLCDINNVNFDMVVLLELILLISVLCFALHIMFHVCLQGCINRPKECCNE